MNRLQAFYFAKSKNRLKYFLNYNALDELIIYECEILLAHAHGGWWRMVFKLIWDKVGIGRLMFSILHRKELREWEKGFDDQRNNTQTSEAIVPETKAEPSAEE